MSRSLFLVFLILFPLIGFSQEFNASIGSGTLTYEGTDLKGYQTFFDFNASRVEKGLWDFSHSFAKTTNYRTHYEISIPISGSNRSVQLIAQMESDDGLKCLLKMAMKDDKATQVNGEQIKDFMLQFKKYFYIQHFQQEIDFLEDKAAVEAKNYTKSLNTAGGNSNEHMKSLQTISSQIEVMRSKQREIAM